MAQATEKKGVLRAFWEGFKEGWNSSSATAQETPPPAPAEEVITAADDWDVNELQNAAVAAEAIAAADERDMPEPAMTTVAAPQEKRGLVAFFEGFKDGWNNPPVIERVVTVEEEPCIYVYTDSEEDTRRDILGSIPSIARYDYGIRELELAEWNK